MTTPPSHPSRIDRYQIQGLAGQGGMARVYRAWDPKHNRIVAIKMMNPELRQDPDSIRRFRHSARALYNLRHTHITRVFSAGDLHGIPYLVLEYVDGASLDRWLASGRPLDVRFVVHIIDQVAFALDYAHSRGVVHRDIKPSNILVTRDGQRAVLSDFGLALVLGEARLTIPGTILGTPRYMAPEQLRLGKVDSRADIYALGVTCYELLTGQPAFQGSRLEIGGQIINGQFRPPSAANPTLPRGVDTVIQRAMHLDPGYRYARSTQLAQALRSGLGLAAPVTPSSSRRGSSPTPTPASTPHPRSWQSILLIFLSLLTIISVLAFLFWMMNGTG